MRAAMLPLFAIVLACTYLLARQMYSQRVALWSVVLLSLFPPFFLKSIEYRTDNLWNAFWMMALLALVSRPPTWRRWFAGGFLLGCALAVSMKTILLVVTLAGAGLITRYVLRDRTRFAIPALAAAGGFVIVPAILSSYFIAVGAWRNLVYCVITFNTLIEKTRPELTIQRYFWPLAIAAIVLVARRHPTASVRRMFCATAVAVFAVTLLGFWLLVSPRDMLPIMPIGAIFTVAALERFDERVLIYSITAAVLTIALFHYTSRFQNRTRAFVTMMDQVLRLTRPGEPVMDIKGETIYRPRPYYYIFELITHDAMANGLLPDRVPEAVVAARCHVAQADGREFPPRARAFLNANFMDLGRLRAAGQWLAADGSFTIAVPGRYVVIQTHGEAGGTLDGSEYEGARDLAAGAHRFVPLRPGERLAVLWAPAFERGFSPFHLQDRDFRSRGRHSHSRRFL